MPGNETQKAFTDLRAHVKPVTPALLDRQKVVFNKTLWVSERGGQFTLSHDR
jgi:hypothetical protein